MNYLKTGVLLIVLTMLFVLIGGLVGGERGAIYAFIIALIMNFGAYWFSDKIILMMYGAKEVDPSEVPELYNIVKELTVNARLPMPKVYIAPQNSPNAFATGRNPRHSAVCVTQGILNMLSREELKGVIAHEVSHIKNRDTLIMTVAATIAGAITMIANMARWSLIFGRGRDSDRNNNVIGQLLIIIIAPIAALLIQLAISRAREYAADKRGALIAGSPSGLANALLKLEKGIRSYPMDTHYATAHIFIVNPLSGQGIATLFSTHPPIQERVRRLQEMKV